MQSVFPLQNCCYVVNKVIRFQVKHSGLSSLLAGLRHCVISLLKFLLLQTENYFCLDMLADETVAVKWSNTEKERMLVWLHHTEWWVEDTCRILQFVSHHTHREQRWLTGVDLKQNRTPGSRHQNGAHPSCCWFFWVSEWWAPVSRSDTESQLLFQPQSERQGRDVQGQRESLWHHECVKVLREKGDARGCYCAKSIYRVFPPGL